MGFKQLATQLKERLIEEPKLPPQARRQLELDRAGLPEYDAGPEAVAAANLERTHGLLEGLRQQEELLTAAFAR